MREYDIRAPGPQTRARLSGGNQQKIVVARELARKPAALIAHQPVWGLDPGATRFVLERILALRAPEFNAHVGFVIAVVAARRFRLLLWRRRSASRSGSPATRGRAAAYAGFSVPRSPGASC